MHSDFFTKGLCPLAMLYTWRVSATIALNLEAVEGRVCACLLFLSSCGQPSSSTRVLHCTCGKLQAGEILHAVKGA